MGKTPLRIAFITAIIAFAACARQSGTTSPVLSPLPLPVHWEAFQNFRPPQNAYAPSQWVLADRADHVWFDYGTTTNCCYARYFTAQVAQVSLSGRIGTTNFQPVQGGYFPLKMVLGNNGYIYVGMWSLDSENTNALVNAYNSNGSLEFSFEDSRSNYIYDTAAAPMNDDVWFSDGQLARASGDSVTYYSQPKGGVADAIAVDDSENVWMQLCSPCNTVPPPPDVLAKFNPTTQTITSYSFQFAVGVGVQMITGPDGNIWFVGGSTLYRVNVSNGTVSQFTMPTQLTGYLVASSDGTIWLGANPNGNSFGLVHVNTLGSVLSAPATNCPVSICGTSAAAGLTIAQDGTVWSFNGDANWSLDIYERSSIEVIP